MINIETLKLIKVIEELRELSKSGIKPFSECTEENNGQYVFYDERKTNPDGSYKICLDTLVIDEHHDVICHYESYAGEGHSLRNECYIGVVTTEEEPFINIHLIKEGYDIVIYDNNWEIIAP